MLNSIQSKCLNVIRAAITGTEYSEVLDQKIKERVFDVLCAHSLGTLAYYVKAFNGFTAAKELNDRAAYKSAIFEIEFEKIKDAFNNSEIKFLPIKGIKLKRLYPNENMRIMSDVDIVIDASRKKTAYSLMEQLGYKKIKGNEEIVSFIKKPFLHFELHTAHFQNSSGYSDFLKGIFEKENEGFEYSLTGTEFYLSNVLHAIRHLKTNGIGLRALVDIYVIKSKLQDIDFDLVYSVLDSYGAKKAGQFLETLSDKVFLGKDLTDEDLSVLEFLFKSNTYGTEDNRVALRYASSEEKTKKTYAKKRFFAPYSLMKQRYKILKYLPILLPVFWVIRGFDALFNKKAKSELKALKNADVVKTTEIKQILGI